MGNGESANGQKLTVALCSSRFLSNPLLPVVVMGLFGGGNKSLIFMSLKTTAFFFLREKNMKYISLCSGVESASLAWKDLGWEPVFFSEIDKFPSEVLKVRYPSVPNLGDMTQINFRKDEDGTIICCGENGEVRTDKIDLLVGGTPCQDLSVAGHRAGFKGERSSLAYDFVRIAYESGAKWFVWENVQGTLSSNQGRDFASLLSLFTGVDLEVPKQGWKSSGFVVPKRGDRFGVAWRVLDSQFTRTPKFPFAIPQRRKRLFVVGCFGDWGSAAEVLLEPHRMSWVTPTRRRTREENSSSFKGGIGTAVGSKVLQVKCPWYGGEVHPTLTLCGFFSNQEISSEGIGRVVAREDLSGRQDMLVRKMTPVECERLMGFPDNYTKIPWAGKSEEECPESHRYKVCGNSMCVNVMEWIGRRINENKPN